MTRFTVTLDQLVDMLAVAYDLGQATGIEVVVACADLQTTEAEFNNVLARRKEFDLDVIRKKLEGEMQ